MVQNTYANVIFGLKIRQARLEANLTSSDFAKMANISPSYLTEIEKGKKHPRPEKIALLADALGKDYDELVSLKLDQDQIHLAKALTSSFIQQFPYGDFGLEESQVIQLLIQAPVEASSLVHAIGDLAKYADLEEEHLFRAMLRAYQELHGNFFKNVEETAKSYMESNDLGAEIPLSYKKIKLLMTGEYGYKINSSLLKQNSKLLKYRSVYVKGNPSHLFINSNLKRYQIKFLLTREIGYQVLGLSDRSVTSTPEEVGSFQQVLNDFMASYFAGAVLMPLNPMVEDITGFFREEVLLPKKINGLLKKYDVSPEMLMYRFSEILPRYFGLPVHFLRTHWENGEIKLSKYLNMSGIAIPTGLMRGEHFCRRWLNARLLQKLVEAKSKSKKVFDSQISELLPTGEKYLSFGFGRALHLEPRVFSSVVIGFLTNANINKTFRFSEDPRIRTEIINETCERCPLSPEECSDRATRPIRWNLSSQKKERWLEIQKLTDKYSR